MPVAAHRVRMVTQPTVAGSTRSRTGANQGLPSASRHPTPSGAGDAGPGFGDLQSGMALAGGIAAGLYQRERTGSRGAVPPGRPAGRAAPGRTGRERSAGPGKRPYPASRPRKREGDRARAGSDPVRRHRRRRRLRPGRPRAVVNRWRPKSRRGGTASHRRDGSNGTGTCRSSNRPAPRALPR